MCGLSEYEHCGDVVLWKWWFVCGVWGVGTLLGFEETTGFPWLARCVRVGCGEGGCFLGAARHRVLFAERLVVVLVCCLRIV